MTQPTKAHFHFQPTNVPFSVGDRVKVIAGHRASLPTGARATVVVIEPDDRDALFGPWVTIQLDDDSPVAELLVQHVTVKRLQLIPIVDLLAELAQ